jgi:hypothetical protein
MEFLSIRNFTAHPVRRSFVSTAYRPRIDLAFVYSRSSRHRRQGLARQSFFHQPRSDCVAPYFYYCAVRSLSYSVAPFFSQFVPKEDWSRPLGSAAAHPVADKGKLAVSSSGGLASARKFLCRGLGSRWLTERFHSNALVTYFQHSQVFGTARQLKDYAVTRRRLHQRARQR